MSEQWVWRVTLGIVFLVQTISWQRAARRGGPDGKVYYGEDEGVFLATLIRIFGVASTLCIAIAFIHPPLIGWAEVPLARAARWAGVPLAVVGLALWLWVLHHLGSGLSVSIAVREEQRLVDTGPYRFVRHPMYLTYLVLWTAYFLLSANLLIPITGVVAHGLAMIVRAPLEEAMLESSFGAAYVEYRKRTGKFVPRW